MPSIGFTVKVDRWTLRGRPAHSEAMARWRTLVGILVLTGCDTGPLEQVYTAADATPKTDGGRDAGVVRDAGAFVADGGRPVDAALPRDGGFRDGGVPRDAGVPRDGGTIDPLAGTTLYLNLGDSIGAGFNAGDERGYAELLCRNHASRPAYAGADFTTRSPGVTCMSRARSGHTSDDVVRRSDNLPPSGGHTIVTIHVGGNDFNDNITTVISMTATRNAIARWEMNMQTVFDRLREAYDDPNDGQTLTIVLVNIHDPTDGLGTIPPEFDQGFCDTIQSPLFTPMLRMAALANLELFNTAIETFAVDNGALFVDEHDLFLGHGMNAPASDRWTDNDCAHFTDEGHHQLRREFWRVLTGELY